MTNYQLGLIIILVFVGVVVGSIIFICVQIFRIKEDLKEIRRHLEENLFE